MFTSKAEFTRLTYGSVSVLRTTHPINFWTRFFFIVCQIFAIFQSGACLKTLKNRWEWLKFDTKWRKTLAQKLTYESSVKYLWICKWGRWIRPRAKIKKFSSIRRHLLGCSVRKNLRIFFVDFNLWEVPTLHFFSDLSPLWKFGASYPDDWI